jgi:hypothetical protein
MLVEKVERSLERLREVELACRRQERLRGLKNDQCNRGYWIISSVFQLLLGLEIITYNLYHSRSTFSP